MASSPLLSIVVPMYNESEGLEGFFARIIPVLETITPDWEIVCVNDGSADGTLAGLEAFHRRDARIKVIGLSRNFGKELALTAGIDHASGQAVIPIDADLQDPPELIPALVAKWKEGFKVVLATRERRAGDSWLKRHTAHLFYKAIGRMSNITIPADTGDFRLIDREVLMALTSLRERTRFMKGLFAWVGYPTAQVFYERAPRHAGAAKQNYRKLWLLALDGIFSFSTVPLKVWTYIGALISLVALSYALFIIVKTLVLGVDAPGYASLMCVVLFMGGIQLISLGVIGEYIGRIYRETKHRPLYLVEKRLGVTASAPGDTRAP